MRRLFVCFAVLVAAISMSGAAKPDGVPNPSLAVHAATPGKFVPAGWSSSRILRGDLNSDGVADAVLIMEPRPDSDKHRLVVVLANPKGGFDLAAENSELLSTKPSEPGEVKYLIPAGCRIRRGAFTVEINREGVGGAAAHMFTFRRQGERFVLIGYDYRGSHRGSLALSFNMLTGQAVAVEEDQAWGGDRVTE